MSCLIDKLPPSWSAFAGDLRHKQGDLTIIQALKVIYIEDQHRQNSKLKYKLKAKVFVHLLLVKNHIFVPKDLAILRIPESITALISSISNEVAPPRLWV